MNFKHPNNGEVSNVPWSAEEAIEQGYFRYTDENGCSKCNTPYPGRYVQGNTCVICAVKQAAEVWQLWLMGSPDKPDNFARSAQEAINLGATSYYVERLCSHGPHFMRPHVKTGRCVQCATDKAAVKNPFADVIISREEARSLGWPTFKSGEPCKRGHVALRYVSNGGCIDCMNARAPEFELIEPGRTYSVADQMALFIGYAWDGRRMLTPEGKRLTPMQFNITVGGPAIYEITLGRDSVRTSHEAFLQNFVR